MGQYNDLAKVAMDEVKDGSSVSDAIEGVISRNGLSSDEAQRVVEEFNIGSFIEKMQEGTQHEDYKLAEPIVSPLDKVASYGNSSLSKKASEDIHVPMSAFDLSGTDNGVSRQDISGDVVMNSEEKWDRQKEYGTRDRNLSSHLEKKASYDQEIAAESSMLISKIKGNPDLVKTAIAISEGKTPSFIEDLMCESPLHRDEVMDGVVSNESIKSLYKIAAEVKKGFFNSVKGSLSDTGKVLSYPFKNPKTSVGLGLGGYALSKTLSDEKELDMKTKMMYSGE